MVTRRKPVTTNTRLKNLPAAAREGNARYSQDVADYICEQISYGRSVSDLLTDTGMPNWATVARWLRKYEEFREQYEIARVAQADYLADEMLDLARKASTDSKGAPGYKAAADILKWQAMVRSPRKYSDRLIQENINSNAPSEPSKVIAEILRLKEELGFTKQKEKAVVDELPLLENEDE